MSNIGNAGFAIPISAGLPGAAGASAPPDLDHPAAAVVRAARLSTAPRVDGVLDDAAWAASVPVTTFTRIWPHEGGAASEGTEFRILVDYEALYTGGRVR